MIFGIFFSISGLTSATGSRARICCGEMTLVALTGAELARSGFGGYVGAPLQARDPERLRRLVADRTMLATIDPNFPAPPPSTDTRTAIGMARRGEDTAEPLHAHDR